MLDSKRTKDLTQVMGQYKESQQSSWDRASCYMLPRIVNTLSLSRSCETAVSSALALLEGRDSNNWLIGAYYWPKTETEDKKWAAHSPGQQL